MAAGGRVRGHLSAVGGQREVDDTARSLALLVLHSLSAGCHGYLSICPPIWRGWSLGRHPGKEYEIERRGRGGRDGRKSEQYSKGDTACKMEEVPVD